MRAPESGLNVFLVGGAVRDALLKRPAGDVNDRDWVVVGSNAQEMLKRGFLPVGKDFPVFLHPHTKDEYALARTERKTAAGYRGFEVDAAASVTLEEDLARRDLTINAIAQDAEGVLIDPFGGANDLERGVLRHVTHAFREDPVRILRTARFAARWPHCHVAPETLALMRDMVAAGEVDALVPERVWQEVATGLAEVQPSRMLAVLADCGALRRLLPDVACVHEACAQALDAAARSGASAAVRYAVGAPHWHGFDAAVPSAWLALKAPHDLLELARLLLEHGKSMTQEPASAQAAVRVLESTDAFRRPERFSGLLETLAVLGQNLALQHWLRAAQAAQGVDTAAIAAAQKQQGSAIVLGAALALPTAIYGKNASKNAGAIDLRVAPEHPVARAIHLARVQAVSEL